MGERCAHVASAMRQLGFKTKKNTPEGLTTIALQSFDSSEPPSLKRVEDGAFGSKSDRGDITNVSPNVVKLMRMISLLGGLARDAGNDVQELNTLRLWSSHVEEEDEEEAQEEEEGLEGFMEDRRAWHS